MLKRWMHPIGLGSTLSLLLFTLGTLPALAQTEAPLEAGVTATTGPSSEIRNEEIAFKRQVDVTIPAVAEIFADPEGTILTAQSLTNELDGIGVGKNSQIAAALCTIETLEVASRLDTLNFVNFHLNKVGQLLTLYADQRGPEIMAALDAATQTDPDAVYLYIHSVMQASGCVPDDFITVVVEAEETRVETVETIRE